MKVMHVTHTTKKHITTLLTAVVLAVFLFTGTGCAATGIAALRTYADLSDRDETDRWDSPQEASIFAQIFSANAGTQDSSKGTTLSARIPADNAVSLDTLPAFNSGFRWNDGIPADPFDSDYTGVRNFTIFHGEYCRYDYTASAEYKLDGAYNALSMRIAPYADFGENASSYLQVYADGTLVYTSPKIVRKSEPWQIDIDIHGAEYLKIVLNKGGYGCLMLSDVVLTADGQNGSIAGALSSVFDKNTTLDENTVYLSSLSPLNGWIAWNNAFPKNIKSDDYTYARNYFVYHGDYCRYDYTNEVEYNLDGAYKTFSLDFAPYTDFGKGARSSVTIYADEKMIFTGTIDQKSEKASTGALDVRGVQYLRIVLKKGDYGCVILSDAKLEK